MKSVFLGLLFLTSIIAVAQNRAIKFETGTWEEALAKARVENKLIFMDAYTSWCGPCKWMAKNIFTNDTVADFCNANFINCKIDMEKGEGPALSKKYQVQAYPNLLFINAQGELVHRSCGAMPAQPFVALAKDALVPEKQFASLKKKFDAGERNSAFVKSFLTTSADACLDVAEPLKAYFSSQEESNFSSKENWEIILNYSESPAGREFIYLEQNLEDFYAKYGKEEVNKKINSVYMNAMYKSLSEKTENSYFDLKTHLEKLNIDGAQKTILAVEIERSLKKKDLKAYADNVIKYVNTYAINDADAINNYAWSFYEKVDDKMALAEAIKWMKPVLEKEPQYALMDTYAAVLYKAGKMAEAKEAARKAIEQGKKEGADVSGTEELLKKIK